MECRSSHKDFDTSTYNYMEICKYRFTWKMEKLDAPVGDFTESNEFFAGINQVTKFRLRGYPEGITGDKKELFTISLIKTGGHCIEANCRLTCVEDNGPGSFYSTFMTHSFNKGNEEARFKEQHKIPFSSTRLVLICELSFDEDQNFVPYCNRIKDYLYLSSDINDWLDGLSESEKFMIPAAGFEPYIGVHKEVSKCRSCVLIDMSSFFYKRPNPDCDVVNEIVNYMYLGDFIAEDIWTNEFAMKMYAHARTYSIHGLQARLISYFKSHFTKDTVLKTFRLSNTLNDTMLANSCLLFIAKTCSLASEEYRYFCISATPKQVITVLKLKTSFSNNWLITQELLSLSS